MSFSSCSYYQYFLMCVHFQIFKPNSWMNALLASMSSGAVVVLLMTPFDVVSTRLYNQGTNAKGQGMYYKGVSDCFIKIYAKEGLWGFYKGWGASLFRLGPHTVLSLMFWDSLKKYVAIVGNKSS